METVANPTPDTIEKKSEATGLIEQIQVSREQKLSIYNHLHSIGADRDVLGGDKERNRQVLQKWYQTLVINNQRFPADIPITFVLDEFFNAILQQKVEILGHNLHAHMRSFHEWMNNYERALRSKWWMKQNPEQRPKALPATGTKSEQEQQADDEKVRNTIELLYGDKVPESLEKFTRENTNGE